MDGPNPWPTLLHSIPTWLLKQIAVLFAAVLAVAREKGGSTVGASAIIPKCCIDVATFLSIIKFEALLVFKRLTIETCRLRGKFCSWKELSKNVWCGAVTTIPQMSNMLHFGVIFSLLAPLCPPLPSALSSHIPSLPFHPSLPFPKVNKKLSYRSQSSPKWPVMCRLGR